MRLGGPVFSKTIDPEEWVQQVKKAGYRAAYCPVPLGTPGDLVERFARVAQREDIVIAEVGAWCNPLSPDEAVRLAAVEKCKKSLELAETIGARCCVNIAGSCGLKWDGPHPNDLTPETFDRIVSVVQDIIDSVQPEKTWYTLETMPWMYPDSTDNYLALIRAIDRPGFAVHLDPVNLVSSPQRYFKNADLVQDFIRRLGAYIRSCHAKDIRLQDRLTVHLDEVRPGLGGLDYRVFLRELAILDVDMPLMIEHLHEEEEYRQAAGYLRGVGKELGISL
jgi:sugar phosphate isomerase/epimerase